MVYCCYNHGEAGGKTININLSRLNDLELTVHNKLIEALSKGEQLKIIEAADYCEVSPSKISKFVKKLGFNNFKQYKQFFTGHPVIQSPKEISSELERLTRFIENFDHNLVDEFITLFKRYSRIIIFGFGPSFICVEYFAYKLALVSGKNIMVSQVEDHAVQLAGEDTLLIVFSVTGKFSSFEKLFSGVKSQGAEILLILEEYDNSSTLKADNIFFLTQSTQSEKLLPYEKTRTAFFIFIEEILAKLMAEKAL